MGSSSKSKKKKSSGTRDRSSDDEETGRARSRSRQREPATTTRTTTTATRSSRSFSVDSMQLCYFGQIFCACVIIMAIYVPLGGLFGGGKPRGYLAYALAVAIVAIIFAVLGLVLYSAMTDTYGRVISNNITVAFLITKFLVLWWTIAAFLLTFSSGTTFSPLGTSNGYFAVWGGLMFAIGALGDGVSSRSSMSAAMGLFTCAVVLIWASSSRLGGSGGALFAFILSIVTVVIFLVFQYAYTPPQNISTIIFYALAVFWVILPFVTTFKSPFRDTGNGYFASWVGAFCAIIVAT